jgi:molybdopterin/thiamine biosynthesis adenylyltransferase
VSVTGPDEQLRPWFEADPARLEWELAQFAARELPAEQRMGLTDGRLPDNLVIQTDVIYRGTTTLVEVAFPFDYPDKAPTLFGPAGLLERHQNPTEGNFCWAEDSERDWSPESDAAHLVAEDLRWLLEDSEKGIMHVREGEADMPEPITGHLHFSPKVVVIPDPYFEAVLPASEGTLTVLGDISQGGSPYFLAKAANLGKPNPDLVNYFAEGWQEMPGYWVELSPTPSVIALDTDLLNLATGKTPRLLQRLAQRLKKARSLDSASCWLGVTFMEEGPVREEYRRNWVFGQVKHWRTGETELVGGLVRAQALTRVERLRRTPELVGLDRARALLIGAGSLGGPTAYELAKAGVGHIDLVDPDRFDVNNSVRHTLSPLRAGRVKATEVASEAQRLNPFVTVEGHSGFWVGGDAEAAAELSALVGRAQVVVDTTGSASVARILQRHCRTHGKTLVVAALTAGSHGGEIAVFTAGGACFDCFVRAQRDKTVPEPNAAPRSALVTPVNCSHPAFAGAGFEATELAAITTRVVVQATGASGYPTRVFDWAVINFRGSPRWQDGRLSKHPECRCAQ